MFPWTLFEGDVNQCSKTRVLRDQISLGNAADGTRSQAAAPTAGLLAPRWGLRKSRYCTSGFSLYTQVLSGTPRIKEKQCGLHSRNSCWGGGREGTDPGGAASSKVTRAEPIPVGLLKQDFPAMCPGSQGQAAGAWAQRSRAPSPPSGSVPQDPVSDLPAEPVGLQTQRNHSHVAAELRGLVSN